MPRRDKERPLTDITEIREYLVHELGEFNSIAGIVAAVHILGERADNREVQRLTGLNRSNLSTALRNLRTNGVIRVERAVPQPGAKGRPPILLTLTQPLPQLIRARIQRERDRLDRADAKGKELFTR